MSLIEMTQASKMRWRLPPDRGLGYGAARRAVHRKTSRAIKAQDGEDFEDPISGQPQGGSASVSCMVSLRAAFEVRLSDPCSGVFRA
jgi:hypothetical protein